MTDVGEQGAGNWEQERRSLDRRAFLRLGLAGGTASLAAACGWDGGNAIRPSLLSISRINDWVGEKILYSPSRLARTYDASARSARLPRYFISRTMPLPPDPAAWRLAGRRSGLRI